VIRGSRPRAAARIFVRLSGAESAGVRLEGNDLSRVEQAAMLDPEVAAAALRTKRSVKRK
jgi:hypothetical protein